MDPLARPAHVNARDREIEQVTKNARAAWVHMRATGSVACSWTEGGFKVTVTRTDADDRQETK